MKTWLKIKADEKNISIKGNASSEFVANVSINIIADLYGSKRISDEDINNIAEVIKNITKK